MTTQKPFSFAASQNPFFKDFEPTNPFAPVAAASDEVPADAPEGSYTYQLVQTGPAVPSEECEVAVAAVEIMIKWGTTVLHVAHLTPPRTFWVGEDASKGDKSDFFLPEEKLGARRMPLVLAEGGAVKLVIPAGATGTIAFPGEPKQTVRDVLASAKAEPCSAVAGAHAVAMPEGAKAELDVNGLAVEISTVQAGRATSRFKVTGESLPYQGLSLLLHASLLAATALFMPSMAMANDEGITDQQRYELMQALNAADAVKEPEKTDENLMNNDKQGEHGDVGQASKGERGAAGDTMSHNTNRRFGVEGKAQETWLSRHEALEAARDFGMIGILSSMQGSVNSPTSPFGRELAQGADEMSAKGNIFGQTIGDAQGSGGLNLSGIGESGGGDGEGIGIGRVGTVGHDLLGGAGHSTGILTGRHIAKSPGTMRMAAPTVGGRLPPEVIQRVVRQNYGRFKACYENGLRNNPNLQGRVAVRFVIGHDGDVSQVGNGGSDLPDGNVVSCVTRAFYGLSFPHPENGIVTVTYPIVFSPAN